MAGTVFIEQALRQHLADRQIEAGQSVQFGWLIFRIVDVGPPIEFESLDFISMASYTTDLRRAERALALQRQAIEAHSAHAENCAMWHSAIISKSYTPGHPGAFLERQDALKHNASGWYAGIYDDPIDMDDVNSFELISLYELSVLDDRMLPYWLMPVGTHVALEKGVVKIRK